MARYIGPVCRLCRREAMKLFLKGERCYTEKCAIEKRNFPPGQHGKTRKAKLAGYGHFLVNGKKVDIPSYSVKEGDVVTVLGRTQKNPTIEHAIEEVKGRGIPDWLSFDANTISGRVKSMPTREQINLPVQEQLIVELYSK